MALSFDFNEFDDDDDDDDDEDDNDDELSGNKSCNEEHVQLAVGMVSYVCSSCTCFVNLNVICDICAFEIY